MWAGGRCGSDSDEIRTHQHSFISIFPLSTPVKVRSASRVAFTDAN